MQQTVPSRIDLLVIQLLDLLVKTSAKLSHFYHPKTKDKRYYLIKNYDNTMTINIDSLTTVVFDKSDIL